mmetsp:Transcript_8056/g.17500  ORF Transcript_8056/g.17500 Transcript_8056/m.17500 type:complete len:174 (-) Transcript_8056:87-608(-)
MADAIRSPLPNPWQRSPQAGSQSSPASTVLWRAHRAIRIARSLGLVFCALSLVLLLRSWRWATCAFIAGLILARSGGALINPILPYCLMENKPPTQPQIDAAAQAGIFCFAGICNPVASLSLEWALLLENLAFACTYGKRNCLTEQMYAGEITLGKICGLVVGKLRQGVVRCG